MFMAVILKRQLNEEEKKQILAKYGRICFANGHPINPDANVQFDHIRAFTAGGASELNNIAPMCEEHNKTKGTLPLFDFRVKLRLKQFFTMGSKLTLGNLLDFMKSNGDITNFGQSIIHYEKDSIITIEHGSEKIINSVHECPDTHMKYFYATLPIEIIDSDDDENEENGLQPRYLIYDKVFEMFRHFQNHPVLQPSIGRVKDNRILIFDGQHKIASLLWTDRRRFECKIYINPDLKILTETNIMAHDKYSQTRFFASIMVGKLGQEFGKEFEAYTHLEDGHGKSEAGFIQYLTSLQNSTKADIYKKFRSYLYNSIIKDENNKLAKYISPQQRGTNECPLTIDMLTKSIFTHFLYREPLEDLIGTDAYKREEEIQNIVMLMNYFYDLGMHNWNASAGANDQNQIKLSRIFGSKSIMAWSDIMKGSVCGKLDIQDNAERERPFYRILEPADKDKVKKVVENLIAWGVWSSPKNSEIDGILADNVSAVKAWFKSHGLTTGYLMGAPE